MKTTLTLLTILFANVLFGQGTVPNSDFEGWITSIHPKDWKTTTQMLPPGYVTVQRTSNSHSGSYAIELTTIDMSGQTVPGVITLGELGIGYTAGGIAFTDRPEALKGYMRHPSQGDVVMVAVQFYRQGVQIGGGAWSTADSIADYQEFNVPITFGSPYDPDTMNITILTDQEQPGSKLFVDDLEFQYTSTGYRDIRSDQGLQVHPNPCRDHIRFGTDPGQPFEATIVDLKGQELAFPDGPAENGIDTSALPAGTYVLLVRSPLGVFREKIIKQ